MKQLILESLLYIIPIYSGLGFLAFIRPNRYAKMANSLYKTVFAFVLFCLVWNISGTWFLHLMADTTVDSKIVSDIAEVHSVSLFYSLLLPFLTIGYIIFLKEVSIPDSANPSSPKENLEE